MATIKLAVWNMEWLNKLFKSGTVNDDAEFKPDADKPEKDSKHTVGERKALLSAGLHRIDADVIVVVEGPNKTKELRLLFEELAPGEWTTHIQESKSINGPGRTDVWASGQCVGVALRTDTGKFHMPNVRFFDAMSEVSGPVFHASEPLLDGHRPR